ncbi:hypothetical protein NDU88_001272 [Pleurodeles waltl]|uniref:Uncharacterized protein n=1 Tax=Pleurodeles waltl TaxID=8319 RepID=A0AAV7USB9_PLEWA|nr:hypothetical protein NDU88_001272 [Pleurodeles waltl]
MEGNPWKVSEVGGQLGEGLWPRRSWLVIVDDGGPAALRTVKEANGRRERWSPALTQSRIRQLSSEAALDSLNQPVDSSSGGGECGKAPSKFPRGKHWSSTLDGVRSQFTPRPVHAKAGGRQDVVCSLPRRAG